ncbi:MAG: hypothetical protein GF384_03795 [Elusimicrobia bacterium]|nr:hypothetical protein [Elusimicrobiota bacterium]
MKRIFVYCSVFLFAFQFLCPVRLNGLAMPGISETVRFEQDPHIRSIRAQISEFVRDGIFTDRKRPPFNQNIFVVRSQKNGMVYLGKVHEKGKARIIVAAIAHLQKGEYVMVRTFFNEHMPDGMQPQWVLEIALPDGRRSMHQFIRAGVYIKKIEENIVQAQLKSFIKSNIFTDPDKPPLSQKSFTLTVQEDQQIYFGSWHDGVQEHHVAIKDSGFHKGDKITVQRVFKKQMPFNKSPQWLMYIIFPDGHKKAFRFKNHSPYLKRIYHPLYRQQISRFVRNGIVTDRKNPPFTAESITITATTQGKIYLGVWKNHGRKQLIVMHNKKINKGDTIVIRKVFNEAMPFGLKPQWILVLTLPRKEQVSYKFDPLSRQLLVMKEGQKIELLEFIRNGVFADKRIPPFTGESFFMKVSKGGNIHFGSWQTKQGLHQVVIGTSQLSKGDVVKITKVFKTDMPQGFVPQWILELTTPDGLRRWYRFTTTGTHLKLLKKQKIRENQISEKGIVRKSM